MHLHILGISGTFMSALAILARAAGHTVTGSDAQCYPPISDLLLANDVQWVEGYEDTALALAADIVIVGNAIKRGLPVIEAVLNAKKSYTSGPQWLAEHILRRYRVMAVAGTHGKTTTTSMLAYILHYAGLAPGFLIGGVAPNFNTSAQLGAGEWFIIEADEYDTAFFDKRPKFMHYRPEVAILNNLEFDHADIYADLAAIQQQFHYLLKTIPGNGVIIKPTEDKALNTVLSQGHYSSIETFSLAASPTWRAELLTSSGEAFRVWYANEMVAEVNWPLIGRFNVENGLAAVAASTKAGVSPVLAAEALQHFTPVKRRLDVKAIHHGITIYDDFAHHPTAIRKTIQALNESGRHTRILVVLEFASYTMRSGVHVDKMGEALALADDVFILTPKEFNVIEAAKQWRCPYQLLPSVSAIVEVVSKVVKSGDAILVMSNRGFEDIHGQLATTIEALGEFGSLTI